MSEIIRQRFATGRRAFLGLAATGLAVPLGGMAPGTMRAPRSSLQDLLEHPPICRVAADTSLIAPGATPREVKMMWNSNAICTVGVPVAEHLGLFAKHNIKIEMVNVSGTVDQILEALASGKVDAGYGMAWVWLKPLEQGFDVKLTAGMHGGCIRLLTAQGSGITSVAGLKGKTVGTFNMGSPDRIFLSVLASKRGIDPVKDIEWRVYPPDLLGVALQKGEIQAFSSNRSDRVDHPRPRSSGGGDQQSVGRIRRPHLLHVGDTRQPGSRRASSRRRDHRGADGGAGMGGREP